MLYTYTIYTKPMWIVDCCSLRLATDEDRNIYAYTCLYIYILSIYIYVYVLSLHALFGHRKDRARILPKEFAATRTDVRQVRTDRDLHVHRYIYSIYIFICTYVLYTYYIYIRPM